MLPKPAIYRPFLSGKYSVAPGLHALETDFGNGSADQHIFQLDEQYSHFRDNKDSCRREGIEKYYVRARVSATTQIEISRFIAQRLATEYPDYFIFSESENRCQLTNRLTGIQLQWNKEDNRLENLGYLSVLDALADQVPEDLAIWQKTDRGDYISTIHLCAPNHWSPAEKVGKPFSLVHQPVAEMEKLRQRYQLMLDSLLRPKTWVRFAWGLSTDQRLNHHPEPPSGMLEAEWKGRSFNRKNPKLFVRIERQTLTGFPETQAVLFTIRTYFTDTRKLQKNELLALIEAVQSMSEASLRYKGLLASRDQIIDWLTSRTSLL
ncbi:MAG: DUF3445 domain-containing protein [Bacteroidota bacterium]